MDVETPIPAMPPGARKAFGAGRNGARIHFAECAQVPPDLHSINADGAAACPERVTDLSVFLLRRATCYLIDTEFLIESSRHRCLRPGHCKDHARVAQHHCSSSEKG